MNKYEVIGHLHALWWWGLDNARDDGDLGALTAKEIAEAAGVSARKSEKFLDSLVEVGFLDRKNPGLFLHNWYKFAGKLNEKRKRDRERKTVSQTQNAPNSDGIPTEFRGKSQAPNPPTPTVPNQPNQPNLRDGGERRDIFRWYEEVFGMGTINSIVREELLAIEEEHPKECVEHCFKAAALKVPRPKTLSYVSAALRHHREDGCDGNSNRANSGFAATATNSGALAAPISDLERRRAFVAQRGRDSGY